MPLKFGSTIATNPARTWAKGLTYLSGQVTTYGQLCLRCYTSPEQLDIVTFDLVAGMSQDNVSELSHVDCNTIELFYSMDQDRHVSVDRVRKTNGPD